MAPPARKRSPTSTAATSPQDASRESAGAAMTPPDSPVQTPTLPESRMDRISQRAYEIYQRRGGQGGHEMDDWLQAEREIDGER